jgi:hypothetical protein
MERPPGSRPCEQASHLLIIIHSDVQVDARGDEIRMPGCETHFGKRAPAG